MEIGPRVRKRLRARRRPLRFLPSLPESTAQLKQRIRKHFLGKEDQGHRDYGRYVYTYARWQDPSDQVQKR